RIEDTVGERGRDSRSAVRHLDLYASVEGAPDARRRIAFVAPAEAEREPAALRHGLERVGDEGDDRAMERLRVGLDRGHVAGELPHDGDAGHLDLVVVELDDPVHQRRQPDEREGQSRWPRQLEQALDDVVDAVDLTGHDALETLTEVRVVESARDTL